MASAARQVSVADHLLVREMAHHAGNILQLVSSIAGQTFTQGADPKSARRSFGERLSALACSNYMVSGGGWTSTRFADLIDEVLKPFGSRVITEGGDVLLPPELCFDLEFVFHELSTNSMKYGTLGQEEGSIKVHWHVSAAKEGQKTFFLIGMTHPPPPIVPPREPVLDQRLCAQLLRRSGTG